MANQAIRIRLDGSATESDIGALREWLGREKPLEEHVRAGRLQIHERSRADGRGAPMGVGMELVVAVVEAGTAVVFVELIHQVRAGVLAWRENRRRLTGSEPPRAQVDSVDTDNG